MREHLVEDRPAPPSFAEFKASTFQDTDGVYIVNGDEPIGRAKLRAYYDRMMDAAGPERRLHEPGRQPDGGG